MFDRVFAVGRERSNELYECRHCGTAVDEQVAECPACQSTEIASYSL